MTNLEVCGGTEIKKGCLAANLFFGAKKLCTAVYCVLPSDAVWCGLRFEDLLKTRTHNGCALDTHYIAGRKTKIAKSSHIYSIRRYSQATKEAGRRDTPHLSAQMDHHAVEALRFMNDTLKTMEERPDDSSVQEQGCGIIGSTPYLYTQWKGFDTARLVRVVLRATKNHVGEGPVLSLAWVVLIRLNTECEDWKQMFYAENGMDALVMAMNHHRANAQLLSAACNFMRQALGPECVLDGSLWQSAAEAVVSFINTHHTQHSSSMQMAVDAIYHLSLYNIQDIIKADVVEAIALCMLRACPEDMVTQTTGCAIFHNLLAGGSQVIGNMAKHGALKATIGAMELMVTSDDMDRKTDMPKQKKHHVLHQENLHSVMHLCMSVVLAIFDNAEEPREEPGLDVLARTMRAKIQLHDLQHGAMRAMICATENCPQNASIIGEEGVRATFDAMRTYGESCNNMSIDGIKLLQVCSRYIYVTCLL